MSAITTTVHNNVASAANGQTYQPMAGTASTSGSSSGITSNDFLNLLVTEMKNQDPTANNDPNQYINQLVNVNSLEQLISINQELGVALTGGKGSTGAGSTSGATPASVTGIAPAVHTAQNPSTTLSSLNLSASPIQSVQGNLSIPARSPAAARVAHALDGLH